MKTSRFILASRSPRRQELLKLVLPDFSVVPSRFDEQKLMNQHLSPEELVQRLSFEKAKEVFQKGDQDSIVIGGDTVVVSPDNTVFGIPKDRDDAHCILSALSGKTHRVLTGVTICGQNKRSFVCSTEVEFFPLSESDINEYLDTGESFDKAGAYGIQGYGGTLVKEIRGDYFNVVGFPIARFKRELRDFLALLDKSEKKIV